MKRVYTQDLRVRIKFTEKPRRGLLSNLIRGICNASKERALDDVRIKSFTIRRVGKSA